MSSLNECQAGFDAWLRANHRSDCDFVMKRHNRRRLETQDGTRPPRDKTSPSHKEKMYFRQKGRCAWCKGPIDVTQIHNTQLIEVDHINVNLTGTAYNHPRNKQLLHAHPCNAEKSAMSLQDQAKHLGRTVTEILQPGYMNAEEEEEEL